MTTATWFWSVIALLFGINIGSFLNVVIWRLPRGGSLISPEHSYCPSCERRLTAIDLVPLFSFLLLGRRCRTCKAPISWRYFTVELLTGLLFWALALQFRNAPADAVSLIAFSALLIPITFIDLEFFHIPISLNLFVFGIAAARDVWGIAHHEPVHAPLWGWLPRFVPGALAGILIFGGVRVAGWLWKRREAMGLGDVLLARAMGAMLVQIVPAGLPLLRLFPAWVLFSCLSGMVVGIPLIMVRARKEALEPVALQERGPQERGKGRTVVEDEEPEQDFDPEPGTLKGQLADIGYCLALIDLVEYVRQYLPAGNEALVGPEAQPPLSIEEEEYTPDPTAIPFGPFLAVGFLATAFFGETLTAWYLAFALPKG